jgi:hypothetical protein
MPVILATQEAEIRTAVWSQPGQIVCETLLKKTHCKKGVVEWLSIGPEFKPQYGKKKEILIFFFLNTNDYLKILKQH